VVRHEYLLAGCVLVVLGFVLLSVGYNAIQTGPLENTVTFFENISCTHAPASLHPPKTNVYVLIGLGGLSLVGGLGFILSSRTPR
jgi:hypothetical protein